MFALLAQRQFWSRVFGFYVGCVTANGAGHFHFLLRQTLQMPVLSATLQLICPGVRSAEVMPLTDYGAELTKLLTISCKNQSDITCVNEVYISMMSYFLVWKSSNLITPQIPLGAGLLPEDPRRGSSWIVSHKEQTWFCSLLWNKRSHR